MSNRKTKKVNKNKPFGLPYFEVKQTLSEARDLKKLDPERANWAKLLLGVPEVWKKTQGKGVKVAVLDTGVDTDHPDLKDVIVKKKNFTNDNDIEDVNGHGTHCAGIIGARFNSKVFVGVAPKCDLMVAKIFNKKGQTTNEWIAKAIDWAVANGADILSMSFGGPVPSPDIYKSIHLGLAKGVFMLVAAGNEGSLFQNSIGYPGRYGGVITVASHDRNGNPSGFSSRGGEIDIMAPGSDIWSTYLNGGYAMLSGTSMATPFAAGLSALITAKHKKVANNNTPLENNEDLKEHLMWMSTHPGYHDNSSGYGPLQPFQYF
jgi:subtilisin family serine protease